MSLTFRNDVVVVTNLGDPRRILEGSVDAATGTATFVQRWSLNLDIVFTGSFVSGASGQVNGSGSIYEIWQRTTPTGRAGSWLATKRHD